MLNTMRKYEKPSQKKKLKILSEQESLANTRTQMSLFKLPKSKDRYILVLKVSLNHRRRKIPLL